MPTPATSRRSPARASAASTCRCSRAEGRVRVGDPGRGRAGVAWSLVLLLAAATAPFLPLPWAIALLALCGALLLARRPPLREALIVGGCVGLALAALAVGWARSGAPPPAERQAAIQVQYAALWQEIADAARAAAQAVPRPPAGAAQRLEAFRTLTGLAAAPGGRRGAPLLLRAPDGAGVAGAGPGLLHELPAGRVPAAGSHYVQSVGAATLLAIQPLDQARRAWRIVAGRSYFTDRLPFAGAAGAAWAVLPAGAAQRPDMRVVAAPGAPTLVVERADLAAPSAWPDRMRRVAWAALGLALLTLGTLRAVGFLLPPGAVANRPGRPLEVAALAVGGAAAWALSAGVTPLAVAALAAGLALAALGLGLPRRPLPAWTTFAAGLAAGGLLTGLAAALAARFGPRDLAGGLGGGPETLVLRLALAGSAVGLLAAARSPARGAAAAGPWAWLAIAALAVAGAFHDRPLAAGLVLAAACGAAARWLAAAAPLRRPAHAAALALIAALAAAAAWEIAYRARLRADLAALLPGLAPPPPTEMRALEAEARGHFERLDLAAMVPVDPATLDVQDLGFAIWRDSPLARRNALSAVSVLYPDGRNSSFSFGLPLAAGTDVDRDPGRSQAVALAAWDELAVTGETALRAGGTPVATQRECL